MKKEALKDDLKTAIRQLGGIKAVAKRFEIPYRTIQNWSDGTRTPPDYVARMIIEVKKQDRKDDENYKAYINDQEALSWYEDELSRCTKEIEEERQKNEVLQEQFNAMVELAKNRRKEVEANETTINELIAVNEALKKELQKEKHAREVWARQAGTLTRR